MTEATNQEKQSEEQQTELPITLDILKRFPNLQELGALPGDKVVNGKLQRVFSDGSLSNPQGDVLTDEIIGRHANLQELGAKAGDKIVDGKLFRTEELNNLRQFTLGFDEAGNDLTNLTDWLSSHYPIFSTRIGLEGVWSGDEVYGKGFEEADVETRKQMIINARARDLIEEYGYSQLLDTPESGLRTTGEFAKAVASPTTLLPVGRTVATGALIGAGLGAEAVALESLAKGEDIDLEEMAIVAGVGGVLGGGLAKVSNYFRNMPEGMPARRAEGIIDSAQRATDEGVEKGLRGVELEKFVTETTGFDKGVLRQASEISGRRVRGVGPQGTVASSSTVEEKVIKDVIQNEGASAPVKYKAVDKLFGALFTRIKNINEGIAYRLRKYEFNTHVKTSKYLEKTKPFYNGMRALPKDVKQRVNLALANGEEDTVIKIFRAEAPEMVTNYNRVKEVLSSVRKDLREAGYEFEDLPNYFPRLVKDLDGLHASMGKDVRGSVYQESLKAVAKSKNIEVNQLDEAVRETVANQVMRGKKAVITRGKHKLGVRYIPAEVTDGALGASKKRSIQTVSKEQLDNFYYDAEESLYTYINKAVNDSEKKILFKDYGVAKTVDDSLNTLDVENSIGGLVAKANLERGQEDALREMLEARFIGGTQTPSGIVQFLRDTGYASTIANPFSAITQLGDIAVSGALKGLKNTVASMFGAKELTAVDLGITKATQELASIKGTAGLLEQMFRFTGFAKLDRLGKDTIINASIRKARGQVKTAKGLKALKDKYGAALGDEFDSFVEDLSTGKITENVKFFAFNELADLQPISLLEMPEAYLRSPNGRIVYMLKSFMLKQYDVVRRELVQEWNKAGKLPVKERLAKQAEVAKKGVVLGAYLMAGNTGTGMARDFLLRREVKPEQIPDRAVWALTGVYGMSKYTAERYGKAGDIKGLLVNLVTPATPLIDSAFSVSADVAKAAFGEGELDQKTLAKIVKPLPGGGSFIYNWFLGGAEAYNERNK